MSNNIEDDIENRETLLKVKNLSKIYGNEKKEALKLKKSGLTKDEVYAKTKTTIALWEVSLEVKKKEIFVIIGLSGSGKSTLVRCFNMLNKPTSGNILYEEKDISKYNKNELMEYRRNKISMVFQNFGLMSHRDVIGNVEYGLEIKGMSKEERHKKAKEMISMVGLEGVENKPINNLSGGMKQRVGIARALANDPEILLMDEPFSALDPLVRKDMQFELLTIHRKLDKTIIFITHDINEAFKIGDRVAIMKDGELIQVDTPEKMTSNPKNDYVKQFIDSADKTQVISVKNVMITPNSLVRLRDNPQIAIKVMRESGVSSAYVIADKTKFQGVITLDDALRAQRESLRLSDILIRDIKTTSPDTLLTDIITDATEARFPLAVVDDENNLKGIISKVHVLSSM
ncbi:quaternary amine ABC transporter ATP-binding protein [Tissierella creatinophila]|uniref:Quaternary amine transport ATP-binding protein n=1 Tax=Tissierella creatinophila DSM 6911 TaxID=1123403 RepID=A0A1U7M8H3_TISCR|nr:betaine/proline/choline family ABC transporter ATP-binding protein [Tissierella creatinophila]OLS03586.1 glycine betaine transport ATP-binding protein OpuAA [Tissierella creatinophila DSM 6911]